MKKQRFIESPERKSMRDHYGMYLGIPESRFQSPIDSGHFPSPEIMSFPVDDSIRPHLLLTNSAEIPGDKYFNALQSPPDILQQHSHVELMIRAIARTEEWASTFLIFIAHLLTIENQFVRDGDVLDLCFNMQRPLSLPEMPRHLKSPADFKWSRPPVLARIAFIRPNAPSELIETILDGRKFELFEIVILEDGGLQDAIALYSEAGSYYFKKLHRDELAGGTHSCFSLGTCSYIIPCGSSSMIVHHVNGDADLCGSCLHLPDPVLADAMG